MNVVITVLLALLLISAVALLLMFWKLRSPALRWPFIDASVENAEVKRVAPRTRPGFSASPCWICSLRYVYSVKGRVYGGEFNCVLPSEQVAHRLAEMKKGQAVRIHYNTGAPEFSFLDREEEDALTHCANLLRLGAMMH
jgi:hypothetical protein